MKTHLMEIIAVRFAFAFESVDGRQCQPVESDERLRPNADTCLMVQSFFFIPNAPAFAVRDLCLRPGNGPPTTSRPDSAHFRTLPFFQLSDGDLCLRPRIGSHVVPTGCRTLDHSTLQCCHVVLTCSYLILCPLFLFFVTACLRHNSALSVHRLSAVGTTVGEDRADPKRCVGAACSSSLLYFFRCTCFEQLCELMMSCANLV